MTVDGEVAILGRRVDPEVARVEVDGVPVPVAPDLVVVPAEQAVRCRHDAERSAGTAYGRRPRPCGAAGVPRRAARLRQRRAARAHQRRRAHAAPHASEPRRRRRRIWPRSSAFRPRVRSAGCAKASSSTTARPRRRRVAVVATRSDSAALELVIHEGRNRQVRRMCEAIGHPVTRLVRTRIGPLSDARLAPGEWRPLEPSKCGRSMPPPSGDRSVVAARLRGNLRSREAAGAPGRDHVRREHEVGDRHEDPAARARDARAQHAWPTTTSSA